jgi:hypothetical protein
MEDVVGVGGCMVMSHIMMLMIFSLRIMHRSVPISLLGFTLVSLLKALVYSFFTLLLVDPCAFRSDEEAVFSYMGFYVQYSANCFIVFMS